MYKSTNKNPISSQSSHTPKVWGEQGVVSILVTMVIMIILSLIVIGFAQLTRREQRQTLDRQLYSQANYAAETGINDANNYIKNTLASGAIIPTLGNCSSANPLVSTPPIVSGSNASYSCVLINPEPTELIWQRIDAQSSIAFPFKPQVATSSINFDWQDADTIATSYGGCAASGTFPAQASWGCQAGALRVDLTPVPAAGLDRNTLINSTQNFILYPISGGPSSVGYGSLGHGTVVPVGCNTSLSSAKPRHCQVTLTNTNPPGTTGNYFVRIRPIYRAANIEVTTPGGGIKLLEAQAIVDSTGKATDILKRLQVRVPVSGINGVNSTIFDYAVQSIDSFCKLYAVIPNAAAPTPPILNKGSADTSCIAN